MNLIMDEKKYAENVLNSDGYGDNTSRTTIILAKYFKSLGHSDKEIQAELEQTLSERVPRSTPQSRKMWIKKAIDVAKKYPLLEIDQVTITKPEMAKIEAIHSEKLKDYRVKRLAFTLVSLAKFNLARGGQDGWVNLEWKYIFKIADLRGVTVEKQNQSIRELHKSGLIMVSPKIDSQSLQVLFLQDGEPAVIVDDINEAGAIYQQHMGRRYVKCQECGKRVPVTNGRTQRCSECAAEHNRIMACERAKRQRISAV